MYDGLVVALVLVLILIGLGLVILPIIGLVIAVKANRRAKKALAWMREMQAENVELRLRVAATARPAEAAAEPDKDQPAEEAAAEGPAAEVPEAEEQEAEEPEAEEPEAEEPEAEVPEAEEPEAEEPEAEEPAATEPEAEEPADQQPTPAPIRVPAPALAARDAVVTEPDEPEPPAPPSKPASPQTLEEKIGLVWFTRIGALIGIIVAGWFFKYMVDNEWIGPWGRVALGWLAGVGLLIWGERLIRRKRKPVNPIFSQGMLGLGLSVLLIATYAAFGFYKIVPVSLAFGLVAVLCLLGGTLAFIHRSQGILVLSMLAVFANPIMLSTGVDRPLALFSYLALMTGGALVVALRLGFRAATWTAVGGVLILFAGWYGKFFDPSPPPEPGLYDQLPELLAGAYHQLSARWVPLLFGLLFPIAWALVGWQWRSQQHRVTSTALFLTGSVAAHAASAALLFDHPLILAGALCGLGLGSAWLLTRTDNTPWLGLPMLASFGVLAGATGASGVSDLLPLMLLTGGLSTIYFGVILRSAMRQGWLASGRALLLTGGAGLGLAVLSGAWMLPDHSTLYGLILCALSGVYLWLALTAGSVWVIVSTFAVSVVGLTAAGLTPTLEGGDLAAFLAIAGVWFLIYVGFVAADLFVRGASWNGGRLAVLAGAGVCFIALTLLVTPEGSSLLRALLSLGTGLVYLPIGLRMLKAGRTGEDAALLPLGLALGMFSLAIALLLSGPSITVAWAIEAAVLAWLAARAKRAGQPGHPGWLTGALIMFGVAAMRFMAVDLPWLSQQAWQFYLTDGAEGLLAPTAFLHPRAWGLLAIGAAALVGASQLARLRQREGYRWAALVLIVAGHASLLGLLVGEARLLLTSLPDAIPAGLPSEEFRALHAAWDDALYAQTTKLDTVTTIVFGLYSFVLLGVGFGWRSRLHRLLGIGLFGLALIKLGLYDIWALETLLKIVVGASIAGLLLAGAFLYGRFGDRIKNLLVEGDKASGLLVACLAAALCAAPGASAADWDRYERVRPITGVEAAGDHRLEIDPALYAASRSAKTLSDLRIQGPDGQEVPWVRRPVADRQGWVDEPVRAQLLDPVRMPDGTSRVILDLGDQVAPHNKVVLTIAGQDFLRRTRVESSQDGRQWGLLAEGGFVFHVTGRCATSQRKELHYPTTNARYLRVSLLPASDGQPLRIQAAKLARTRRPVLADPDRRIPLRLVGEPVRDGADRVYELGDLPTEVPFGALELEVATPAFVRRVELEASTRRQAWFPVGSGVIHRVQHAGAGDTQPRIEEHLAIGLTSLGRPLLRLRVADGDDPPLKVTGASGVYRAEELVFRARTPGAHRLYIGRADDRPPVYDLASLLARGTDSRAQPVQLGPLADNPDHARPTEPTKPVPWTEQHAWVIQLGVALLAGGLLIWTGLLIRRSRRRDPD